MLQRIYIQLIGVESILFFAHILLLYFVELLLLCLLFEIERILLFVKGGLLLSEDVVYEAVGLFRIGPIFLSPVVEQLYLP